MLAANARFRVGQIVHHTTYDYRGVVCDVDPYFQGTEEWYEKMAQSHAPKDVPWYRVLVDGQPHITYVAERNLEADERGEEIQHPAIEEFFAGFSDGTYIPYRKSH